MFEVHNYFMIHFSYEKQYLLLLNTKKNKYNKTKFISQKSAQSAILFSVLHRNLKFKEKLTSCIF